jgi:hypothetical protein
MSRNSKVIDIFTIWMKIFERRMFTGILIANRKSVRKIPNETSKMAWRKHELLLPAEHHGHHSDQIADRCEFYTWFSNEYGTCSFSSLAIAHMRVFIQILHMMSGLSSFSIQNHSLFQTDIRHSRVDEVFRQLHDVSFRTDCLHFRSLDLSRIMMKPLRTDRRSEYRKYCMRICFNKTSTQSHGQFETAMFDHTAVSEVSGCLFWIAYGLLGAQS